jgi:hypothetical protein
MSLREKRKDRLTGVNLKIFRHCGILVVDAIHDEDVPLTARICTRGNCKKLPPLWGTRAAEGSQGEE